MLPFLSLTFASLIGFTIGLNIPRDGSGNTSAIRWVDCSINVPFPIQLELNVTTFNATLPSTLFCGEIDVPMDYSKPIASDNQITVGFAMNRPENPTGLVAYHAGGPGLDAASAAWDIAFNTSNAAPFTGLEDFDFIGINTRGLQFSNPLNCTFDTFFANVSFGFPSTQSEFDQYQTAMGNLFQSCMNNTSPPGIVQYLGTPELIQDWDLIRAALGYEQVHFIGVSYGTFVGAAYAAKFPDRVGHFILDATIPHGMPFQDMVTDQVAAINRLLLRADAFCLTDTSCPFHGQGKGSVVKAWETVLARAIQQPIPASQCGPGTGCNTPVTPTDLRVGASVFLRSDPDFPLFNLALSEAVAGDASKFAYVPAGDIRELLAVPLLCSDFKIENKTFAAFQALSTNSNQSDPAQMVYSQIWQFYLMCSAWPFDTPDSAAETLPTDLPIMWATSDFDLNLPTELTTFAFEQTPNATLVIRHGDDHVSILLPNVATHPLEIDFIRTGVFPAAQNTSQVTVIPPGGKRSSVALDPYAVPLGTIAGDFSSIETLPNSVLPDSEAATVNNTSSAVSSGRWSGVPLISVATTMIVWLL